MNKSHNIKCILTKLLFVFKLYYIGGASFEIGARAMAGSLSAIPDDVSMAGSVRHPTCEVINYIFTVTSTINICIIYQVLKNFFKIILCAVKIRL